MMELCSISSTPILQISSSKLKLSSSSLFFPSYPNNIIINNRLYYCKQHSLCSKPTFSKKNATITCAVAPLDSAIEPLPADILVTESPEPNSRTSCSVEAILQFLQIDGHAVNISKDAGRFICNYVYYHTLLFAEQKGHKSLFVHVPLFSKIKEETQMEFVAALLEAIAATC